MVGKQVCVNSNVFKSIIKNKKKYLSTGLDVLMIMQCSSLCVCATALWCFVCFYLMVGVRVYVEFRMSSTATASRRPLEVPFSVICQILQGHCHATQEGYPCDWSIHVLMLLVGYHLNVVTLSESHIPDMYKLIYGFILHSLSAASKCKIRALCYQWCKSFDLQL